MEQPIVTLSAEEASDLALKKMFSCLDQGQSFLLEAGAGSGKTYSLIKALLYIIDKNEDKLHKYHQKVACITYTNVAKNEILSRTDHNPLIQCETIHSFCWSLISGFQKQLREKLPELPNWKEKIDEVGEIGNRLVDYSLGYRKIKDDVVLIHHDDVIPLTVVLMDNIKFRRVIVDMYPVILIDEYQDTNVQWIDSIKKHFLGKNYSPLFGFFGDHWQKIYGNGCGIIEHENLVVIAMEANFRSGSAIVECLNRMRPELPQNIRPSLEQGSVHIFHTNQWQDGERLKGGHWNGALPHDVAHSALDSVKEKLGDLGWNFSSEFTKILMLTHSLLAKEQGYEELANVFEYNDDYLKPDNEHIKFFIEYLEPACNAYFAKKYGQMFAALDTLMPSIRSHSDKQLWSDSMVKLIELRSNGTVGQVIDHLIQTKRPRLPEKVIRNENELLAFDSNNEEKMPRYLVELQKLRQIKYLEVIALSRYLDGVSPFQTKHGVKGAQFENVLVVIGRGWNRYNFNEMLELFSPGTRIQQNKQEAFERNRNLFYVTCSRPKKRLAILFTQKLSDSAMETVARFFGKNSIQGLQV